MELKYDIATYLTSVKMSSKIRVLVEGRDDQAHLLNILPFLCKGKKIKIDIAADIKGECQATAKNNRAKIERIHELSRNNQSNKNIFFLCDRETRGFAISDKLRNSISGHHVDGALSWTLGHSIENYFFSSDLLAEGLRYLTSSAHKGPAVELFKSSFESSVRLIACLTLAAQSINTTSLPCGLIQWRNIKFEDNNSIAIDYTSIKNPLSEKLQGEHEKFKNIVAASDIEECSLICRGHTAVILFQRIFSACLFLSAATAGSESPALDASIFNSLDERNVAAALSESWIKRIESGNAAYPAPLIEAILSA
jgi:5S rRNA maturation endonuclease (ribonuclease M5)